MMIMMMMMRGCVALVWFLAGFRLALAAPSTDACPLDSLLKDNHCVCNPFSCQKPPCLSTLTLRTKGTEEPGSCCPIYTCEGCKNDTLLDGKCPCAPGATINHLGVCECVDKERHLVDGECVCNPRFCELPRLVCDRKSVPTTIEDGCCRKTRCVPCPLDSESTNLDTAELEDHCVCLPCVNDCGLNKTVVIKKKGTGFPGNCCDLYECRPLLVEKENDCVVGDIMYKNGEEWFTDENQKCTCENGVSLCAAMMVEQPPLDCWDESVVYKHNETWLKEKGCTLCQCLNGEPKCISHYCDVPKEGHIAANESVPCVREERVWNHLEQWQEVDGCTECTCLNGEERCDSKPCENHEPKQEVPGSDKSCWIITGALSLLILGIIASVAGICIYKMNKRQYSVTPSRGSYHSVTNSTVDNNNTIKMKKHSLRFDSVE
ncbi:cysteine-rich motor neuron 1 protein-like isoform X2 [Anthonomus grandis grandis]|uniref:cysteine-rich motor neuron 1 protein-like isoform X2 n=1 Tax=Anthonomus grandis grandis TaxID=2921223 RepID=UPI0021657BDA|nr:cysteine-rich motor neuron 1 protein-like isoform X2 [Anthonomus grandis grandis]